MAEDALVLRQARAADRGRRGPRAQLRDGGARPQVVRGRSARTSRSRRAPRGRLRTVGF